MPLTPDTEAQILRRHHVDQWPVGTIAAQLGIHRDSVARVLCQAGLPLRTKRTRPSAIDPWLPFIRDTLAQFPNLCASRLYVMVKERGYPGRPDHFRHLIARHRPRVPAEAYLRLTSLPGEQCQIDWGHFGHLQIGRARRPLMAFVAVLSWSREIFLRFYPGAHMENFLRGHVEAFTAWGGVPRVALYDNLKSAVLEREGRIIRFNPTLSALSGHYRFEPRPVAVARGNQKGRVERAIRYIRDAFFAGRTFSDMADLNAQALAWTSGPARERRCPEDETLSVGEAFASEQSRLLALPGDAFPTEEVKAVCAGKTPYVRFDLNDYSIPHTCVSRTLTVRASLETVRVLEGQTVVATHPRVFGRGERVELAAHIDTLTEFKRGGAAHSGSDRLASLIPSSRQFLAQANERGEPLGRVVRALTELLEQYGTSELAAAIDDALARGVAHPNALRGVLEKRRQARAEPPPVAVALPAQVRSRDVAVRSHALGDYDGLMGGEHDQH